MRVEQHASLRIASDGLNAAQISDALGVQSSRNGLAGVWVLEPAAGDSAASLDDQVNAVISPLFGAADKLSELVRNGAEIELFLTRSLLGPGVGMLCFMLDGPVIKFLAEIGASVWFDEYDESAGAVYAPHTPPI